MKKIIFDTNFIFNCVKYKVDFISELNRIMHEKYEVFVLDSTKIELDAISKKETKNKPIVKLVLSIIAAKNIKVIHTKESYADQILFDLSKEDYTIATNDKILKQRIKDQKKKVIFIRKNQYLIYE